jgi:translation initiation factor 4A
MTSFDDFDLNDNLLRGIYSYGFENPSDIQCKALPIINAKRDLIAQAQSGTGKTGAFTIGSLNLLDVDLKKTQVLILNPTYELVNQNYDVMKALSQYMDVSIMKVVGKTSVEECKRDLQKEPQIIIGTPGRVLDMINKRYLFTTDIKLLVFDEADEMLSGGFQENMYHIIKYISKTTQICLFSATRTERTLELSERFLNNPETILVENKDVTLEGIQQFKVVINEEWKYDTLIDIYNLVNISQCIIYVNYKNKLMNIYDELIQNNYPVDFIHGEITKDEREKKLLDFKNGQTRILLSTDLLSRGIDIQQLNLVINYDLPKSKETYVHRIGRSGRYGRKGVAINFITNRELGYLNELEEHYNIKIDDLPQNVGEIFNV